MQKSKEIKDLKKLTVFQELPLDTYLLYYHIREERDIRNNCIVFDPTESETQKLIILKSDSTFMAKVEVEYLNKIRTIFLSIFCEKRDRRFVLKKGDSIFYKIAIYFEYFFSGLDTMSRIKRSLLLSSVFSSFSFIFPFPICYKLFGTLFGYVINWLFQIYANFGDIQVIRFATDTNVYFKGFKFELAFFFNMLSTIQEKCKKIFELYITWPNMKTWTITHWGIFCGIALRSLLWVEYFFKDIFTTKNIFNWTYYDFVAGCIFLTGYIISIGNTIHCVEPTYYVLKSSYEYVKSTIENVVPKEQQVAVLNWYTWAKQSSEPQIRRWGDYFTLWFYRFRRAPYYPWGAANKENVLDCYEQMREQKKELDKLKALTKKDYHAQLCESKTFINKVRDLINKN